MLTLAALVALVSSAGATATRKHEATLGAVSGADPQSIAVDQGNGDVYAASVAGQSVSRFNAAGSPVDFTAGPDAGTNTLTGFHFEGPGTNEIAVDASGGPADGDIYVADILSGTVKIFASSGEALGTLTGSGTAAGAFSEPCGVAVDQSNGDLYVAQFANRIWRYSPAGGTIEESDYSGGLATLAGICQIAVGSGQLYGSAWETSGPLFQYSTSEFATGAPPTGASGNVDSKAVAVAVDPATGDVYSDEGDQVSVFDPSGTALYSFGSGEIDSSSAGVAVKSGGSAYVADPSANKVAVFGPFTPATVPASATTKPATEVNHVHAVLNGHLDTNGGPPVTSCSFAWGTTTGYGNVASCAEGNSYSAPADVSAEISGLSAGDTYHYRLVIKTTVGTFEGADETLTTPAVVIGHSLHSTVGETGQGDGQFTGLFGEAVNQSSGDLYVADTGNHRLEVLDADGGFLAAWGWGVSDGSAASQVCAGNCQAGVAGSGQGQLSEPTVVAVDNSGGPSAGDVYVADAANDTVTKFDSTGHFLARLEGNGSGAHFVGIAGVAVDSNGDLWVYDTSETANPASPEGVMREFLPNGDFVTEWSSHENVHVAGLAVDSNGDLYLFEGAPKVAKFSPSGIRLGAVTDDYSGSGLAVDPETDDLYVSKIERVGETENIRVRVDHYLGSCEPASGPCQPADSFGSEDLDHPGAVAVNGATGRVYVADGNRIKIFDRGTLPSAVTGSSAPLSSTSASVNGTVSANNVALTECSFQYVADEAFLATGFRDLGSGGTVPCDQAPASIPADLETHPVTATIIGLDPTKLYHYRLVASNAAVGAAGESRILAGQPLVETTGSPVRTATTARLDSRLDPRGQASYHFEYGTQGPCDANPCISTEPHPAGSGEEMVLVSQSIGGLQPGTTYHYRLVADNGNPGGAAFGSDMTVTTRSSDAPLSHGDLPGPPDSDRAWEQVSAPDTSGNPIFGLRAMSADGQRVIYGIDGGSPGSQYGGGLTEPSNLQFTERTTDGWESKPLYPNRSEAPSNTWRDPSGRPDLGETYAVVKDFTNTGPVEIWRLQPGAAAERVLSVPFEAYPDGPGFTAASADGSKIISVLRGDFDSGHPVGTQTKELYDLSNGKPEMIGLLPDGSVPTCGVTDTVMNDGSSGSINGIDWVASDDTHVFFQIRSGSGCDGTDKSLYVRDLAASTTTKIADHAAFIRSTGGAAYFATTESIATDDSSGNDIYKFDIATEHVECITCIMGRSGLLPDTAGTGAQSTAFGAVVVSNGGSRIYFESSSRLLPGAAEEGIYVLHVQTGGLFYLAPLSIITRTSSYADHQNAFTPDGSIFIFSAKSAALSSANGPQNGGSPQYYRYDDRDHSIECVSCPGDGTGPRGAVSQNPPSSALLGYGPLDDAGDFVFATPTPLVAADQNTAPSGHAAEEGSDIYEWRDGQLHLVTDGTTRAGQPTVSAVSANGEDIFFEDSAQLTPDAIDNQRRLYDARSGGGFEFPGEPPPCQLDACQGSPAGALALEHPSSASFNGPGNETGKAKPRCKKHGRKKCEKPRHKGRKHHHQRKGADKGSRKGQANRGGSK